MAQYATVTDMQNLGLPDVALVNVSSAVINDTLAKSSGTINSFMRAQYSLPLSTPYPDEVVWCCVCIASYRLMVWRGYNPHEFDAEIRKRYEDCMDWLRMLARGEVALDADADATPAREGAPRVTGQGNPRIQAGVVTNALRGW
jgi:phage gp36-like protein